MNDLETTVRETLTELAGDTAPRRMPPDTLRHLRRRQAGFLVGIAAATAFAVVGAAALVRVLPHGPSGTGLAGGSPVPPWHPIEVVPEGWPAVDVLDPERAFLPPLGARQEEIDGAVEVLASGTAAGAEFSMLAWTGLGDPAAGEFSGPCIAFNGPFTPGRVPPPSPDAGFGGVQSEACAAWADDAVPAARDIHLRGQSDGTTPGLTSNYGFLSPRVARLRLELGDGSVWEIAILEGPSSWEGVRAFLLFPPVGAEGVVVALDEAGRPLARAPLCMLDAGMSGGCLSDTEQLVDPGPGGSLDRGVRRSRQRLGAIDGVSAAWLHFRRPHGWSCAPAPQSPSGVGPCRGATSGEPPGRSWST
ncbi:MAG: hypothetical protein HY658_13845 [Actinobacteria bacterium]|nr:hypothetical protein [Actinomycetota bacterium]